MTIKHIVINGGGPNMFYMYGALKYLHNENYWKLDNIENIYVTSAGALIIVIVLLINDWEKTDNFLINRNWSNIIDITSIDQILLLFNQKGIYTHRLYEDIYRPLLKMNNLSLNLTLKEFSEFTKKNFYIYCSNLTTFKSVCLSNKTDPDITLLNILQMTSAVPGLVEPILYKNEYYFDGGLFNNYPLKPCYDNKEINPDEILAFNNYSIPDNPGGPEVVEEIITAEDNFFKYIEIILKNLIFSQNKTIQPKIKNEVHLKNSGGYNYEFWNNILTSNIFRVKKIEEGIESAKLFLCYEQNKS